MMMYIAVQLAPTALTWQALDRFVIGHEEWGEVQFLLPVDVRGLDLDELVSISKGRMQVYGLPGGSAAPALGTQLNVPAMLTFRYLLLRAGLLCLVAVRMCMRPKL